MKKNLQKLTALVFAIILSGSALLQAESPRAVLMEHMTNASCPPCAALNPGYQEYLMNNADKNIIPITYRAWYPGDDEMYNQNSAMHRNRVQYYGSPGVPNVRVQGSYNTNPASLGAIDEEANKYLGTMSPITLDIVETRTGNNMDIKVNVSSDEAITSKTLRVAVVEFYHYYDAAGSNGEKEFHFIVRDMLPSANGQMINIAQGESEEFQFNYSIFPSMYNADQMYVVAFIQDDATKEVLQAGTSLLTHKPSLLTDVKYNTIESNKILSKEIVISNPSDQVINFDLSINEDNTVSWLQGWTAEVTPKTITVPAGGTKKCLVNIKSSQVAGFFWTEVVAEGQAASGIVIPAKLMVYALATNTEYVYYYGASNSWAYAYDAFSNYSGFYNNFALMPISTIEIYDPTDFELFVIDVDYWNGGVLGSTSIVPAAIMSMIDSGKDVLINAQRELFISESQDGSSQARQFFRDLLGVELNQAYLRVQTNSSGQITGIIPFQCTGVANDPVGDGFNKELNQWSQSNHPYIIQTDVMSIMDGSDAVPFLYYDNDETHIGGIHWAKGTTRLIYTTFGINALSNANDRHNLMSSYLSWLLKDAVAGPELALSKTKIDFGTYEINETKEMTFKIENVGSTNEDLAINKMSIASTDGNPLVFSFEGLDDAILIPAGESYTVTVGFTPTEEITYNAEITVEADNSVEDKELSLSVMGTGKDSNISVAKTDNGAFAMSAAPNPFETVSRIDYTVSATNNEPVNIIVMDASGKVVKTLVNSTLTPGNYSVEFSGQGLASGTYFVIGQIMGESIRIPLILNK